MKKIIAVAAIASLGVSPLSAGLFDFLTGGGSKRDSSFVTIGTGGVTGTYYPTGGAVCRLVNKIKQESGVRCSVESTGGSVYNINNIAAGELDLGMAQSDVVYQAANGTGKFEGKQQKGLRSVMAIYPELFTFVASKKSGIRSLEDVKGKKINVGNYGSGTRATAELLFEKFGIDEGSLALSGTLKPAESPDALRDSKIDGYFYIVGHPTANIKDAANSVNVRLVEIDGPEVDSLIEEYPYFAKAKIAGGLYKGVDRPVTSLGVKAVLVASDEVSEKAIYTVTKAILENFDDFKKLHPAYANITKKSLLDGLSAPLHDGAKKYYEETGLLN